jgi:hypothetical protein
MNNSLVIETMTLETESVIDFKPHLRSRETELINIIEAIDSVSASSHWKLLQEKVFNGVMDSLQSRIRSEKNPTEIYRLQGQIGWAEKYSDLSKLSQAYRKELSNVRNKLNGKD